MAELYFKTKADYEEVIKLREQIEKLRKEMVTLNKAGDPASLARVQTLGKEYSVLKERFADVTREAALAGGQYNELSKAVGLVKSNIAGLSGMMLGGAGLGAFATQVVKVRGEVQQFEVAFETMLGSAKKAKDMMADLNELAVKTPFTLPQVVQGAKQLTAYGVEAEEVVDTLRHLGDVAAGLSLPVQRLVGIYGQVLSQGKVSGMTLRRSMMAGIPVTEELAKVMGKTAAEVKSLVSAGKVGAAEFKQAIWNMSSEGGKFYNLMDKQAKTITGQISNLGVALHHVFDEIGESQEGPINKIVGGVANLIEHYKELGEALLPIIAAYGTYKASLMLVASFNKFVAESEMEIMAAREAELNTILKEISADTAENNVKGKQKLTAMELINLKRQEIQLEIESLTAQLSGIEKQKAYWQATEQSNRARIEEIGLTIQSLEASRAEASSQEQTNITRQIGTLEKEANTAATVANTASIEANALSTKAAEVAEKKETLQKSLNTINTKVDTATTVADTGVKRIWIAVTNSATKAIQRLKMAVATNPVGFALTAISTVLMTLLSLVPMYNRKKKESLEISERLSEETRKERVELNALYSALKNTESGTDAHKKAIEKYNSKAKEYNTALINENDTLDIQIQKYKDLKDAILAANAAKLGKQAKEENSKKEQQESDKAFKSFEKEAGNAYGQNNSLYSRYVRDFLRTDDSGLAKEMIKDIADNLAISAGDLSGEDINTLVDSSAKQITDGLLDNIRLYYSELGKEVDENMLRQEGNDLMEYAKGFLQKRLEIAGKYQQQGETIDNQLNAFQSAAEATQEVEDYENMSYELLKDSLNKKKMDLISASDEEKATINAAIDEISAYMDATLTKGSLKALQERLKDAKSARDSIDPSEDNEEWRKTDRQVARLDAAIKRQQSRTSEQQSSNLKARVAYNEKRLQAERDAAKQELDILNDTEQARIDLMRDSEEKSLRQINLDRKKELEEIERWYNNLIDERIKQDKELFEANPANKDRVFTYNRSDYSQTPEQAQLKEAKIAAVIHKYAEKTLSTRMEEMDSWNEYLREYGSYEEKKLAIVQKYENDIYRATSEGEKKRLALQRDIELANVRSEVREYYKSNGNYSQRKRAINEEYKAKILSAGGDKYLAEVYRRQWDDELMKLEMDVDGSLARVFGNISKYTAKQLEEAKKLAEAYKAAHPELTPEQMKALQEQIDAIDELQFEKNYELPSGNLNDYIKNLQRLASLRKRAATETDAKQLENLNRQIEQYEELTDEQKASVAMELLSSAAKNAAGFMRDLADATGDVKLEQLANAAEGLEFSVSLMTSIVTEDWLSAITQVTGAIVSAVSDEIRLSKELEANTLALANAIEQLDLTFDGDKFESIFGGDGTFQKIYEYSRLMKSSYTSFTDAIDELMSSNLKPEAIAGRARQDANYYAQLDAYNKAIKEGQKGIQAMLVKTKDRSGILNYFGFSDEYKTLADIAPQIFNADGTLNIEKTDLFLQSDLANGLDTVQRQMLENAMELHEKYQENLEGLKSELSSLFGNVNDALSKATMDGIRSGSMLGVEYLKKEMTSVVDTIEQPMLNAIYGSYTKKYENKILAMVDQGGASSDDFLNVLNEMLDNIGPVYEAAQTAAKEFEDKAREKGYDIGRATNADATTGSYQQISETTGSAIQGGVTSLRISSEIRNQTLAIMSANLSEMLARQLKMVTLADDIRNIQVDSYLALVAIRNNTADNVSELRGVRDMVERIEKNTRGLS